MRQPHFLKIYFWMIDELEYTQSTLMIFALFFSRSERNKINHPNKRFHYFSRNEIKQILKISEKSIRESLIVLKKDGYIESVSSKFRNEFLYWMPYDVVLYFKGKENDRIK